MLLESRVTLAEDLVELEISDRLEKADDVIDHRLLGDGLAAVLLFRSEPLGGVDEDEDVLEETWNWAKDVASRGGLPRLGIRSHGRRHDLSFLETGEIEKVEGRDR